MMIAMHIMRDGAEVFLTDSPNERPYDGRPIAGGSLDAVTSVAAVQGRSVCVVGDLINHFPFEQKYMLCEPMRFICSECGEQVNPWNTIINMTDCDCWKYMYHCDCGYSEVRVAE